MPPPRNEQGRSRANAIDPEKCPDQRAARKYAPPPPSGQVEIARIIKSARAELRIGIAQCDGRQRLFLRQFETNGARSMRATGKGVVFDPPHLRSLIAAFEAAESIAIAAGMLPPRAGGRTDKGSS